MIQSLLDLAKLGGPVVLVIAAVGLVLFERCLNAILFFYTTRKRLRRLEPADHSVAALRRMQQELEESYERKRLVIATMVTAAPLLGLLGTVSGMISTFHNMALQGDNRSIEGLAGGISEALTATQAGLVVAVPGVLALYYAHRQAQKGVHQLVLLERRLLGGS